jgi:soluble epoxide hydrolase/lipid-phosphate phosphatase
VLPNFKYQIQLAGPEVEATIVGGEKIREFLNGMYGGRSKSGQPPFTVSHGCHFEQLPGIGPSPLLNQEEMDWYVKRYAIHGMHGPLNWYRVGELNHADEKEFVDKMENFKFDMPVLFIGGSRDMALPPSMAKGMSKWCRSLTKGEVNAGHWALWEKPAEINQYLKEFLVGQIGSSKL